MTDVIVVGAGPAGLMAAETVLDSGLSVTIADAKPSFGRKFLMAGKSGLNLTKNESQRSFLNAFSEAKEWLEPTLRLFGPEDVVLWSEGLGQDVFTGSSGRVFPKTMKASPLLRAWLKRLESKGAVFLTRHRWVGFEGNDPSFETPDGKTSLKTRATILALGGASWKRLGSDGNWGVVLGAEDFEIAPFAPSNMGIRIEWSQHMQRHFGAPVKNCRLSAGEKSRVGEFVISAKGLEGSLVYGFSPEFRAGRTLTLDLAPDKAIEELTAKLQKSGKKLSFTNRLRKAVGLPPGKVALYQEFSGPTREPAEIANQIKALPISYSGVADLDEAISVAGGLSRSELTASFMLRNRPGVFCAGEMLDWEAPTGGYLITACLATGKAAGHGATSYLRA